jgi:hypothetical protein
MAWAALLLFTASCNSRQTAVENKQRQKFALTINLPFESSNYYDYGSDNDTNFVLKDSNGRICIASRDTITNGGGTVTYNSLPAGIYEYNINTILEEQLTGRIQLTNDSTISLSAENLYHATDAIILDSLITADSLHIILSDTLQTHTVKIYKKGNRYSISINLPGKATMQKAIFKDSASTISALMEMETALLGLKAMGVQSKEYFLHIDPKTYFYMKTGNAFVSCLEIEQQYFNPIHKKFIKAISK